jgi:hypothetical protein
MSQRRVGLNIVATFAIMFLLGSGLVVYAVVPEAAAASGQAGSTLASDPSGPSSGTQGAAAIGDGLSYALAPLPTYLHQAAPASYPFKEGGALIVVSGDQLQVKIVLLGSPRTDFAVVVQTFEHNVTVGLLKTTLSGSGTFSGNITLSPGAHAVGLLVFIAGDLASPVGVSVPRTILVTLPATGQASTSTSSSATTTTTSQSSQAISRLALAPITLSSAPSGYLYGKGTGGYEVAGGYIYFGLSFTGQNPNTQYSLVLSVNGSARTIGEYTTNANGGGRISAGSLLGTGRFVLSLTVDDLSFDLPAAVLGSVPSSFAVTANRAVSSTSSPLYSAPKWVFSFKPAQVANAPTGYRFATFGIAVVSMNSKYSLLTVDMGFRGANPSTTYVADLLLNGTRITLGTMTTNKAGGAQLQATIQVVPGDYLLGIAVSDVSSFKANGPVLVMVSDPETQLAMVVPPAQGASGTSTTTSNSSQGGNTSQPQVTSAATIISAGSEVQAQIQGAVDNLAIPATVQVTPLSSSTSVLDSRFSLSVGQQVGNGLVISISGENVTGPRVLLINMSRTAPLALYPALNVTLDGMPVAEASSALQVLDPSSTTPFYVLVAASNSIQLLISIPHFSFHLVEVAGVVLHDIQASLELDAPLLVGSILVITLAFAAIYAARKRYFSVLP